MILCQFVSENMIAEEKTDICCVVLKDIWIVYTSFTQFWTLTHRLFHQLSSSLRIINLIFNQICNPVIQFHKRFPLLFKQKKYCSILQ